MNVKDIFYPLMLLTCLGMSVVVANFDDNKWDIVRRVDERHQTKNKAKGRHRSSFISLHDKVANTETKRDRKQPLRNAPVETANKEPVTRAPVVDVLTTASGKQVTTDVNFKGLKVNQTSSTSKTGNHDVAVLGTGVMDQMDMKTVFFILLGISSLVIAYFVIRIARSKSRRKTKKYGVLATHGSEVELRPLEQEDEDEDMTVFDANSH